MAQKLKARKLIVILAFVSFCILTIPTVIYWCNFRGYKLSDSPGDWGVFGDYMGGVLNPLLSIVNLIVLGYLTIFVSEQDNRMALNQFRFDLYVDVKEKLTILDRNTTKKDLDELITKVRSFGDFGFLFDKKADYQSAVNRLKEILDRIGKEMKESLPEKQIRGVGDSAKREDLYNEIKEYNKTHEELLLFIQTEITKK